MASYPYLPLTTSPQKIKGFSIAWITLLPEQLTLKSETMEDINHNYSIENIMSPQEQ